VYRNSENQLEQRQADTDRYRNSEIEPTGAKSSRYRQREKQNEQEEATIGK
jgi:hypothetical protein